MKQLFAWQCKCGHVEHSKDLPEDCPKCLRVGKFAEPSEDALDSALANELRSINEGDAEDED